MRTITKRVLAAMALVAMVGGTVAVSGGTASADAPAGAYVALGDSYASGDGAPPYEATPNCHRSAGAWARQLANDASSIDPVDLVACGGATTAHLVGPWAQKGLPAQIPAAATPTTSAVSLVTLVIGGNDVGTAGFVNNCKAFVCPSPTAAGFKNKLTALKNTLVTTVYPRLRAAYPNAVLAHVGYPQGTPAPGTTPVNCGWLSKADQQALTTMIDALDQAIRDATLQYSASVPAGVQYVDVRNVMLGHEMCTASPWINPLANGGLLGLFATASANTPAHPNAAGQKAIELTVADVLGIPLS
jgi:lysophospholipase L1-like esterase